MSKTKNDLAKKYVKKKYGVGYSNRERSAAHAGFEAGFDEASGHFAADAYIQLSNAIAAKILKLSPEERTELVGTILQWHRNRMAEYYTNLVDLETAKSALGEAAQQISYLEENKKIYNLGSVRLSGSIAEALISDVKTAISRLMSFIGPIERH
jgi:hypothetical protein